MSAPQLLDVAAAAAAHRKATAATRALPDVLHVGTYTSTLAEHRTRPYRLTVKVGSIVRAHGFATEAERDREAAQARADLALLADRLEGSDLPARFPRHVTRCPRCRVDIIGDHCLTCGEATR